MVRALHAALPSVEFRLTVRGGRGMTAEQMLPLIDAALKQQRYPLVLWQTGTVEAVRGLQPDGMLDVLHAGAERSATRAAIWCWSIRSSAASCAPTQISIRMRT